MQGHPQAPDFDTIFAKYAGEACALAQATKEFEQAWRDFHNWERARLQQVTPTR